MNMRWFINRLRSLHNIDAYLLPELNEVQCRAFLCDPVPFFLNDANGPCRAAIWREVGKRQSKSREEIADRIHAIAVKNGRVLPEQLVRDMIKYLEED